MFRSKSLIMILVCLLSTFFVQNMALAHPDQSDIDAAKDALDRSEKAMDKMVARWGVIRSDFETLLSEYEANKKAVEKGRQAALTSAGMTVVTTIAAAAATIGSGGSLAPVLAPAAFAGALAVRDAVAAGSIDSEKLVATMGILLSLVDAALKDVNAAWKGGTIKVPRLDPENHQPIRDANGNLELHDKVLTGYFPAYRTYATACARHVNRDYNTFFAEVQTNSGSIGSHTFEEPKSYCHNSEKPVASGICDWETWDLPSIKPLVAIVVFRIGRVIQKRLRGM